MTSVKPSHLSKSPAWKQKRLERLLRLKRYHLLKIREIEAEIQELRGDVDEHNA